MIRVAIVDDEREQIEIIKNIVEEFFKEKNIEYQIQEFLSGEDLLNTDICMDLVFLDIQMGGIDGIETARKLRIKYRKTTLIYISNYTEKMALSFTVHPFAFLGKPIKLDEIKKHLTDYLSYIESLYQKKMVSFNGQHGEITVDIQNIIYFEYTENRKIRLIMTDAEYCIIGSMSELVKRMIQYDFISPHKSFLINESKIRSIYSSLVMVNGDEIPIAKNRKKQIQEQIYTYLHNHLLD